MHRLLRRLRDFMTTSFRRYLVIGGVVYLFELVVIFVAQQAGANPVVAVGLSFWLGLTASFLLTKFVTFQDKRTHHKILIPQIVAVGLLVLFNFGFTLLATQLLLSVNIAPAVSRTAALAVTTIWNFYLYRTRIFKTSPAVID